MTFEEKLNKKRKERVSIDAYGRMSQAEWQFKEGADWARQETLREVSNLLDNIAIDIRYVWKNEAAIPWGRGDIITKTEYVDAVLSKIERIKKLEAEREG